MYHTLTIRVVSANGLPASVHNRETYYFIAAVADASARSIIHEGNPKDVWFTDNMQIPIPVQYQDGNGYCMLSSNFHMSIHRPDATLVTEYTQRLPILKLDQPQLLHVKMPKDVQIILELCVTQDGTPSSPSKSLLVNSLSNNDFSPTLALNNLNVDIWSNTNQHIESFPSGNDILRVANSVERLNADQEIVLQLHFLQLLPNDAPPQAFDWIKLFLQDLESVCPSCCQAPIWYLLIRKLLNRSKMRNDEYESRLNTIQIELEQERRKSQLLETLSQNNKEFSMPLSNRSHPELEAEIHRLTLALEAEKLRSTAFQYMARRAEEDSQDKITSLHTELNTVKARLQALDTALGLNGVFPSLQNTHSPNPKDSDSNLNNYSDTTSPVYNNSLTKDKRVSPVHLRWANQQNRQPSPERNVVSPIRTRRSRSLDIHPSPVEQRWKNKYVDTSNSSPKRGYSLDREISTPLDSSIQSNQLDSLRMKHWNIQNSPSSPPTLHPLPPMRTPTPEIQSWLREPATNNIQSTPMLPPRHTPTSSIPVYSQTPNHMLFTPPSTTPTPMPLHETPSTPAPQLFSQTGRSSPTNTNTSFHSNSVNRPPLSTSHPHLYNNSRGRSTQQTSPRATSGLSASTSSTQRRSFSVPRHSCNGNGCHICKDYSR